MPIKRQRQKLAELGENGDEEDGIGLSDRRYISGNVPRPDPTRLTTDQLRREIKSVKEMVDIKLDGMSDVRDAKFEIVTTRLSEMDKAIILLQTITNKTPEFVRDQVGQLKDVHNEKFQGMASTFAEKIASLADVTTQQFKSVADQFAEKDKAVGVGLQTQSASAAAQQASNNEATAKMEANFTKLLDQGRDLLAEVRRNTDTQINDIKSRLDKGEGRSTIVDPAVNNAISQLAMDVRSLREDKQQPQQQPQPGLSMIAGMVLTGFVVISSMVGVAGLIIALVKT